MFDIVSNQKREKCEIESGAERLVPKVSNHVSIPNLLAVASLAASGFTRVPAVAASKLSNVAASISTSTSTLSIIFH